MLVKLIVSYGFQTAVTSIRQDESNVTNSRPQCRKINLCDDTSFLNSRSLNRIISFPEKEPLALPLFLKWAGGKLQLIEQFKNHFPLDIQKNIIMKLGALILIG